MAAAGGLGRGGVWRDHAVLVTQGVKACFQAGAPRFSAGRAHWVGLVGPKVGGTTEVNGMVATVPVKDWVLITIPRLPGTQHRFGCCLEVCWLSDR